MQILHDYLTAICEIKESDKEHTHRSALENLFKAILENLTQSHKDFSKIAIIHEPNNDKSEKKGGAPDFQVVLKWGGGQNNLAQNGLTLGYIENKRVNADLAELIDKSNANPREQIAKYLTLSDNLILTDYLRFLRIAKDDKGKIVITQEITICTLNEIQSTLKNKSALESKQSEILDFFALFFSATPKSINTALEFASTLAQRTRLVFDILAQNPQNPQISTLYQNFRDILYKDLDFESFCDSFAQTLTYALFLARLNNSTEPNQSETIDLYNAKKFIPKSFPLIRAMSGFLDNLDELDSLKWLIKEILSIINHIDPAQITLELNKIADKDLLGDYLHKDPYLHFYETFLSQYDPRLRELRGVYYTPFAVVSFIINAIDSTLKADFGEAKGLGSALNNDTITLLDFATGTGTFLLEAFRKALESTPKNSLHYKPKNLLNRFSGFEFLIAPYTIAHLKISQSFKEEFSAPLEDNEKLNILLTNTIYAKSAKDEANEKSNLFAGMYELAQEFLGAQNLKEQQILIITGNPPYSGASANKGLYEDEVKIAYGLEPSNALLNQEARRIIKSYFANPSDKAKQKDFKGIYEARKLQNEKNPKWLLDDYVKFIRFAESKIESQESGIIAIISNNSFLDNPTFRGMRYHLLNTFDKIYIVDLHGNARKKEVAPDGNKDDNVFDIMQGVCISVFVKLPSSLRDLPKANRGNPQSPLPCEVESQKSPLPCGGGLGVGKNPAKPKSTPPLAPPAREGEQMGNSHNDDNLARIFHYDLFGKRKDKYAFLQGNSLKSIAWSELAPKAPFYLFIPQNEALKEQYDKGISVTEIFKVSSTGICSQRDSVVIHKTKESIEQLISDFCTLSKDENIKKYNIEKDGRDWQIQTAIDSIKQSQQNKSGFITQIHYRPFDFYWTYYNGKSKGFMAYPRGEVMKHFLPSDSSLRGESKSPLPCGGGLGVGKKPAKPKSTPPLAHRLRGGEQMGNPQNDNVGLVCDRGCKLQQIDNIFVANNIIDLHLTGSGSYIFPLYLKIENEPKSKSKSPCEVESNLSPLPCGGGLGVGKKPAKAKSTPPLAPPARGGEQESYNSAREGDSWIENFTPTFRAFVDKKYGQIYAPEQILGYIYAVLYHKDYREKYVDFLKIDFPKIPFVESKKDFLALSALGCALVDLHLMRVDLSGESVGEPLFNDTANKNERIDKIAYNTESKRLFVNASLYFANVSAEVWEYKIGGYAVLDKYLKSHKGESIDYTHFERVIKTLHKSLEIESKIAQISLD